MKLKGKVAIVTGASPNIGGALARGLAREGAKVACNDINPETAQKVADKIIAEGGEAMIIPGDVTNESFVRSAVQQVVEEWGHVDILVNNAVKFIIKGILDMSTEELCRFYRYSNQYYRADPAKPPWRVYSPWHRRYPP